jgi:small subunit ribosomal protein S9
MSDQTPQDPQDEQTPAQPEETPAAEATPPAEEPTPAAEEPTPVAEEPTPAAEETTPAPEEAAAASAVPQGADAPEADLDEEPEPDRVPRVKPAIPGADLEVDIVLDGEDRRERSPYDEDFGDDEEAAPTEESDEPDDQPIAAVEINLSADARYRATGKRKTAVARVILRPGTGAYTINGRSLDEFFPRPTLQRNIRQPLEAVGYAERMDVVARMHGGGVAAQAGALRHGISRALLEADPNLRSELKRRGFLTRDARAKERKKAGLKKARKKPQFSKR